jgi:LEM3 (ligand-effect modulator 3) family / CDC50 family
MNTMWPSSLLDSLYRRGDLISCDPLRTDGDQVLNPCGLIANSFFNDVITVRARACACADRGGCRCCRAWLLHARALAVTAAVVLEPLGVLAAAARRQSRGAGALICWH